jgi:hypothetical protein
MHFIDFHYNIIFDCEIMQMMCVEVSKSQWIIYTNKFSQQVQNMPKNGRCCWCQHCWKTILQLYANQMFCTCKFVTWDYRFILISYHVLFYRNQKKPAFYILGGNLIITFIYHAESFLSFFLSQGKMFEIQDQKEGLSKR